MDDERDIQPAFSSLEIDTIGEIMSISMGSAATTVSALLGCRVSMADPVIGLIPAKDFALGKASGVTVDIRYTQGIEGANLLLLDKNDVRVILSQMLMTEYPEDFEIDSMAESAICELMNQMMGASATVMSSFLGKSISISTPATIPVDSLEDFCKSQFVDSDYLLTVAFTLGINGGAESSFISAMKVALAKEITQTSLNFTSFLPPNQESPPLSTAKILPADPAEVTISWQAEGCEVTDIIGMRPGGILAMELLQNRIVTLLVNGKPVAKGKMMAAGGMGVRITDVLQNGLT